MSSTETPPIPAEVHERLTKIVDAILQTYDMNLLLEESYRTRMESLPAFTLGPHTPTPLGLDFYPITKRIIADRRTRINQQLEEIGGIPGQNTIGPNQTQKINLIAWNGAAEQNPSVHLWTPAHNREQQIPIPVSFFDNLRSRYLEIKPVTEAPRGDWASPGLYR